MATFSNAQKLAAVLTEWARPAISQIFTSKLGTLPFMQSMQSTLIGSGLVSANYKLINDIMPFMSQSVQTIIQPFIEAYAAKMPDASIPNIAHAVVDAACEQPNFSILDGLVNFEQSDMQELKDLLDKNLPLIEADGYEVIK